MSAWKGSWLKPLTSAPRAVDHVQTRKPLSFFLVAGVLPASSSYTNEILAYLRGNPDSAFNHPNHPVNRRSTRYYDGFCR